MRKVKRLKGQKAKRLRGLFAFLSLCLLSSLPLTALAGVEVLFSPRDNINYRIIEAINLSEDCIDIATFDFTSREIADALVNAKKKGLKIRLIVDKKLLEDEDIDSQAKHLEEMGFDIKALKGKGKGVMKNSFVIFDGNLVIVGPYQLTEDKENYNYENAIFLDDHGIVETYQNEFDKLFGKRGISTTSTKKPKDSLLSTVIKPSSSLRQETGKQETGDRRQDSVASASNPTIEAHPSTEEQIATSEVKTLVGAGLKPAPTTGEKPPAPLEAPLPTGTATSSLQAEGFEPRGSAEGKAIPPPTTEQYITQTTLPVPDEPTTAPGNFINISFEELDKIFGKESALSEAEKNALWPKYMGRYVKWTGEVTYTLLGLVKGTRVGLRHKQGSDTNTEVRFSIKKAPKIMGIAEGDTITYTAKLFTYPATDTPYYVLNEGSLE